MPVYLLVGKRAPSEILVDIPHLISAYHTNASHFMCNPHL
jgi:hypothetical protein